MRFGIWAIAIGVGLVVAGCGKTADDKFAGTWENTEHATWTLSIARGQGSGYIVKDQRSNVTMTYGGSAAGEGLDVKAGYADVLLQVDPKTGHLVGLGPNEYVKKPPADIKG